MRTRTKAKLIATAGVASVIMGGVLVAMPPMAGAAPTPVLNPGGNDNPSCSALGYSIEAKHNVQESAPASGSADSGNDPDLLVNWTFNADGTIDFAVDEDSDYLVSAAIVKQAAAPAGGGAFVYSYNPAVASDTGLVDPKGDKQFSHITFCSNGDLNTTTTTAEETTTTAEETTTTAEETTTTVEETTTTVEETTTTVEETTTTVEETTTTVEETTTTVEVEGTSTTVGETTTTDDPEVEGESTTVPAEVSTTQGPTVQGQSVTLPATGSSTDRAAGVGVALMIFGAILVGGSRRALLTKG